MLATSRLSCILCQQNESYTYSKVGISHVFFSRLWLAFAAAEVTEAAEAAAKIAASDRSTEQEQRLYSSIKNTPTAQVVCALLYPSQFFSDNHHKSKVKQVLPKPHCSNELHFLLSVTLQRHDGYKASALHGMHVYSPRFCWYLLPLPTEGSS